MCALNDVNRPVCVFDSGIGGLNLLYACAKMCPETNFMYFADNYNVPYGSLSEKRVKALVHDIFDEIASYNPLAVVVACNTVTALCISDLRARYNFPILGIQPAIKQAVRTAGDCLVLATPATVSSPSFKALCNAYGQGRVKAEACPSLASYIEDNIFDYPDIKISGLLPAASPSSVVLGCTHYVFAAKSISEAYSCATFDGILGTADHLRKILKNLQCFSVIKRIIQFKRGDNAKNQKIFNMLLSNLNK